ncbi:hypothetical protein RND81_06G158500 [Saponaria officinalis]|uniref:non-specific serine/threonine protein kinase n=1 Tax=Saponaria officinalis TaxID=3572 RepID=A0AAW1KAM5_SAPOF
MPSPASPPPPPPQTPPPPVSQPPPPPVSPPPPTTNSTAPPPRHPAHSGTTPHNATPSPPPPPPPSGGGGVKSENFRWGIGGKNGISSAMIVGIAIAGVALVIVVSIICVCCFMKKSKRRRRNVDDHGDDVYYVHNSFLPYTTSSLDGHYDVHWQQNYSPTAENHDMRPLPPPPPPPVIQPRLPPRPPFHHPSLPPPPATYMSPGGCSESSTGSEIPLTYPSPGYPIGFSKSAIPYQELAIATDNFSEANMLGQGDYGCVHKGVLSNAKMIAVKSLKAGSDLVKCEFQAEVEIIGRLHHRYLVSLVGYCITESHWLLVYEFVSNRSLEFHLHGKGQPTMDWPTRLRIAKGSAKGLAYLHEDCHPKIIHGDVKAANILLNHKFEPKVADFGRAKIFSDGDTHVSTRVIGTLGYLAPEYAATGKLSDKSDVFSFGVVLLELITGCRPADSARTKNNYSFVDWARPLLTRFLEGSNFEILVDPRLQNKYDPNEMARMIVCAAACVRQSAQRRPRMSQVVRALEGELSLSENNEGVRSGYNSVYSSHDSDNNEGIRPRQISAYASFSSENDSGQYKDTMKKFKKTTVDSQENGSSEYDGTTSEYGVYPSGLSSEIPSQETTREIETVKTEGDSRGVGGRAGL